MTDPDPAAPAGDGLDRVLDVARRHLDMDLVVLSEFRADRQLFRRAAGDASWFSWQLGDGPPLPQSYCYLVAAGTAAAAVPDAGAVALLQSAGPVRSYVGAPVRLADGSVYGSVAAFSRRARPVDDKDVRFMQLVAERVQADAQAERDAAAERARLLPLIENGRIDFALQPVVDLNTGRAVGAEALSRFPGGYGAPNVVFAAAHAAGLGLEMELLAATRARRLVPLLQPDQHLSINVTPGTAVELARRAVESVEPLERLALEFLEHAADGNHGELTEGVAAARREGCKIAIDDAGGGRASLHHIAQLRPDILKLDRSVVHGLAQDSTRRSVVRAFVALAADLGSVVVAAGVETQEDLDAARELGVDAAQGYLLARPTTDRDDIAMWLAERTWKEHLPRPPRRGLSLRRG